jgi:hypothetical protein
MVSLWPRRHTTWRSAPKLRDWTPPAPRKVRLDRAIWVTIALVLLLSAGASYTILQLTGEGRWSLYFLGVIVGAVFAGKLIGEYVWTVVGSFYTGLVLRVYAHFARKRGAKMMITPYPDFVPGRLRQTWEAMGFAAGLSLLAAASILFVTSEDSNSLPWLSLGGLVLSCVLTFMLVPHWTFARLGLRVSEPQRFVVSSLAESYSGIVRVSNGTILLGSTFYGVNALAGRATRLEIWILVAVSVAIMLAISLVAMGTATAYYKRHEEMVLKRVAADAKRLGFVPMTGGNPSLTAA